MSTQSERNVSRVVRGMPTSDGAGVRLTRVIGQPRLPDLDPFLMLDEFGTDNPGDYIAGFPDHPHRGFETVTYMLDGRMRHRDNHGHEGVLVPGSVQWMTAGRGIVHSEMPEQQEGRMRGFQLWINLPAREKMTAPKYQEFEPQRIPAVDIGDGARVKVIAGRVAGVTGPIVQAATDPTYLDVELAPGATLSQPLTRGYSAFLYVYEGTVRVGTDESAATVAAHELAVLTDGDSVRLEGREPPRDGAFTQSPGAILDGALRRAGRAETQDGPGNRAILLAGRPLREPVAKHGPFVMSTREELIQAFEDYQSGRF